MLRILLIILTITVCNSTQAQNYNCFQPGGRNYFVSGQGYVRGIRIDSVRVQGSDTVYFPYRTLRNDHYLFGGSGPVDTLGASWLGKKVIRQPDGTFLFDNMWDTVILKSQSHAGDSWTFYNDTSVFSYIATVTAEDTATVLGSADSVKKITITAYKNGLPYPEDPINGFEIQLSKNNGFVQVCDLYTFPYHRPDTVSFHPPSGCTIRGFDWYLDVLLGNLCIPDLCCFDALPNASNSLFRLLPFYNPTTQALYDATIGDVFETKFTASDNGGGSGPGIVTDIYTLDSVLTKTVTAHSTTSTGIERRMAVQMDYSFTPPHFDTTVTPPAPFSRNGTDSDHLVAPGVMPEESYWGYLLHYLPLRPLLTCGTAPAYVTMGYSGCVYDGISSEPVIDSTVYSVEFGITARAHWTVIGSCEQQSLIYVNKSGVVACGNFVPIADHNTSVRTITAPDIFISPNPADAALTVSMPGATGDIRVEIYDVPGKKIFDGDLNSKNQILINTLSWHAGTYVAIIFVDGRVASRRIIAVQH